MEENELRLKNQIQELDRQNAAIEAKLAQKTSENLDLIQEIRQENQELLGFKDQLAAKESAKLELASQIEVDIKELEVWRSECVAKEAQKKLLRDSLKMTEAARTSLAKQVDRLRSEADDLAAMNYLLETR